MNITLNPIDEVNARLTVTVSPEDYREKVQNQLKEIRRNHVFPGFRKGQIPFQTVEKRFGASVTSDTINQQVFENVYKYIEDNKLEVLGAPVPVDVKELDLKNQDTFTFEYDLALAPKIDVKVDNSISLPYYNIEITDDMVAERDTYLRRRFGVQGPSETMAPDAVLKGALVELDENGAVKTEDEPIQVADAIFGPQWFVSDDQKKIFEAVTPGAKVVFNPKAATGDNVGELASMLHIDKQRAENVNSDFEFTVSEIITVTPAEEGEDFYKQAFGESVKDHDQYIAAVRAIIAGELAPNSEAMFQHEVHNALLAKAGDLKLPAETLQKWMHSRNPEATDEAIAAEFKAMENDLRWQLVRDAVAEQLNVTVEEQDLMDFAKQTAARQFAQYGMNNIDDDTLTNYAKSILADKKFAPRMHQQVADMKFFSAIKKAVKLDTKTVTLDEFRKLAEKLG